MRRKDKQMTEEIEVTDVLQRSQVCRLAMSDGLHPYIVPLCFGFQDNAIYVHSASEGRKLDLIRKNNSVCFEFDIDIELVKNNYPCDWSMRYKSVIGYGKAIFLDDIDEKRRALDIIMRQYSTGEFVFPQSSLDRTIVIKIEIECINGKKSGY